MNETTQKNTTQKNTEPNGSAPNQPVLKKKGRPKKDPNAPKVKNPNMNNNPDGGMIFQGKLQNIVEGDTNKILLTNMRVMELPPIKITDPPSVHSRIMEYFQIYAEADLKPTVAGLAMALGIDRRRLWEIKVGKETFGVTTEISDDIKKAYMVLENMWESYMNSGKINPVSGIFLGKNHFGYQDKMEYVVTPNTNTEAQMNEEDLLKRYALTDGAEIEATIEDSVTN